MIAIAITGMGLTGALRITSVQDNLARVRCTTAVVLTGLTTAANPH